MIVIEAEKDIFLFKGPEHFENLKKDSDLRKLVSDFLVSNTQSVFAQRMKIIHEGKKIFKNEESKLQYFYLSYKVGILKMFYESLYPEKKFEDIAKIMQQRDQLYITKRKIQLHFTDFKKNIKKLL